MEQKPLYDSTNMNLIAWGQPIVRYPTQGLAVPVGRRFDKPSDTHGIAWTNYAGSEGYHWWETANLDPAWAGIWTLCQSRGDYSGLFTVTRVFDMSSIKDGTSTLSSWPKRIATVTSGERSKPRERASGDGAAAKVFFVLAFVLHCRSTWTSHVRTFPERDGSKA